MLGEYLSRAREEKGWSQRELSRRAGVSYTQVQRIENGEIENPGIATLLSISKALSVPVVKLVHAFEGRDPDLFEDKPTDEQQTAELLEALEKAQELLRRKKNG